MVVLMLWGLRSPLKVPVRLLLLRLLRPLLWLRLHLLGRRFLRCKIRWELQDGRERGGEETPRNSLGRLFQEFGEHEQVRRRQLRL
jgi:hypothetical protein